MVPVRFFRFDRLKRNHFAVGTFRGGILDAVEFWGFRRQSSTAMGFAGVLPLKRLLDEKQKCIKKCQPEEFFRLTYLGVLL